MSLLPPSLNSGIVPIRPSQRGPPDHLLAFALAAKLRLSLIGRTPSCIPRSNIDSHSCRPLKPEFPSVKILSHASNFLTSPPSFASILTSFSPSKGMFPSPAFSQVFFAPELLSWTPSSSGPSASFPIRSRLSFLRLFLSPRLPPRPVDFFCPPCLRGAIVVYPLVLLKSLRPSIGP